MDDRNEKCLARLDYKVPAKRASAMSHALGSDRLQCARSELRLKLLRDTPRVPRERQRGQIRSKPVSHSSDRELWRQAAARTPFKARGDRYAPSARGSRARRWQVLGTSCMIAEQMHEGWDAPRASCRDKFHAKQPRLLAVPPKLPSKLSYSGVAGRRERARQSHTCSSPQGVVAEDAADARAIDGCEQRTSNDQDNPTAGQAPAL